MNKKIKVIELFKRIEKHEDIPQKIKYKDNCYIFKHTNYSIDHLYELKESCIGWLEHKDINLFDEVEILEDNTEEIEELEKEQEAIANPKTMTQEIRFYYDANKMGDKINELVRAVNSIRKNIDKEYCCCCGVEITDENRALHNMCNECKYGIDWEEKNK